MEIREIYLKYKLLLFLYSIDENRTDILKIPDIDDKLKIEINILKNLRQKKKNINNLKELIYKDISNEMKYNIYREIAIIYFKEEKYDECLYYLKFLIDNFYNIEKYRAMIDYCYVFVDKYNKDKNEKNQNNNYQLIKENIDSLNNILMQPINKDLYYEAYYLRKEIYNLIEPDIVMLNSNSLKNISNNIYTLNNQYYILNELKKNIKNKLAIKYYIMNQNNLSEALNKKGEILIIQIDDFNKNGDIICESETGENYILSVKDFISYFKYKEISYKIIILCFPNSYLLKKHFNENSINYKYLITFQNLENYSHEVLKEFNKISIQLILDFIKISVNSSDNIESICDFLKNLYINIFNDRKYLFNCEKNEYFYIKNKFSQKVEYHQEIEENEIFLYEPLIKLDNNNISTNYFQDYSSKVFDLIEIINYRNNEIFYCDQIEKIDYLNISIEAMKFFHRHQSYCEYFYIDIEKGDKRLLKSIIRKLNKIKKEEDEYNENIENYDDNKNYKQKPCFILINNCKKSDLIDVNIYSILNSNSSFIIIYDKEIYSNNVKKRIIKIKEREESKSNNEENEDNIINKFNDYKNESLAQKIFEKNEDKEKEENIQNENLFQYLETGIQLDEIQVKILFYKILKIVQVLHKYNICDIDLEP